ncbi:MAG: cob(I)yrinic acid a,c-diamide adenosyltransferase [Bacteroidaceae bacterium]|nr:cob(I)yrinic acid a,c-diamide adenosyltransferase [Bacteroidaceae bacterium]
MKIYTRSGDDGTTQIIGGKRVKKYDLQVEVYGTFDELTSYIGLVATYCKPPVQIFLKEIQQKLFYIMAWTAGSCKDNPLPVATDIEKIESAIDDLEEEYGLAYNGLILPGGTRAAAHTHVARTICRRAERLLARLLDEREFSSISSPHTPVYLNRLSDYLYTLAQTLQQEK